ncbi:MAG: FHA domain-containing protein [Myxococcales bacterium]|nr:FHA domain-containing protein [Myxococcales bacterium]MCB9650494.1 FHA domain-containing protein [Deltaproteobacteria bacterium]
MARRTRRELDIADHLWDCLTRIAEDCGTDRHAVVNQAIYEFARRFNFLTPMAKEVPPPEQQVGPGRAAAPAPAPAAPPAPERRPAPAPKPKPVEKARKTLYVVNSAGDMHKIDKDTFIIGRSRTCDLVIPSSKVSRQHSGICRENGEYYIEDLGSANGVWKDGVKIQKEKVKDGDEFMISEEVLKFIFR